jgi:HAD superfamily hydrolase (TIGR01490 family)
MSKTLALFDFDGTLSSKDTMLDFILFSFGSIKSLKALIILCPVFFLYVLKLIDNNCAKQHIFKYFFSGMSVDEIKNLGECYTNERLYKIIRPKCIERINWHKKNNHEISIVSASLEYWLKPWSEKMGLNLISTKLEVINNKLTGNYSGKNCHGTEKVNRIKESYDLNLFDTIYAYGDSAGDKQMLDIATESFFKPFR